MASVFRLTCVVNQEDPAQAVCVGDGMNHRSDTPFNYRDKLRLTAIALTEDWEAQEFEGGADDQETFTRVPRLK